jgi:hypothetical protein
VENKAGPEYLVPEHKPGFFVTIQQLFIKMAKSPFCSFRIFFEFKEGENFNHMNTLKYFED